MWDSLRPAQNSLIFGFRIKGLERTLLVPLIGAIWARIIGTWAQIEGSWRVWEGLRVWGFRVWGSVQVLGFTWILKPYTPFWGTELYLLYLLYTKLHTLKGLGVKLANLGAFLM